MHQHPESIVVPLTASKVRFNLEGGKSEENDMANESAMYSAAGTHNPENIGTGPVDAVTGRIQVGEAGYGDAAPNARQPDDEGAGRGRAGA